MKLAFVVVGPPVPKARARVVTRGGRTHAFTPSDTSAWEKLVGLCALDARQRVREKWPQDAAYKVTIHAYRRDASADIDNIAKAAMDSCNGVLWRDDALVVELHAHKHCVGEERLEMHVEVLPS